MLCKFGLIEQRAATCVIMFILQKPLLVQNMILDIVYALAFVYFLTESFPDNWSCMKVGLIGMARGCVSSCERTRIMIRWQVVWCRNRMWELKCFVNNVRSMSRRLICPVGQQVPSF